MATAKTRNNSKSVAGKDRAADVAEQKRREKKTEMYVKFAKIMMMYQGPYSDLRSQELERIKSKFRNASHVISDETYRQYRKTTCAYDRTEEFYEYFREETQRALEEGNNLLVLDPTMSSTNQNRFYLALAYKMQYVFVLRPPIVTQASNMNWPPKSQAKSFLEHEKTHIYSSNMFQHLFCAWYLHDIDSLELRHVAKLYVQDCLENIPEFRNLFARVCPAKPSTDEDDFSDDEEYTLDEYRGGKYKKKGKGGSDKTDQDEQPARCTPDSFAQHFRLHEQRQDLAYCVVKIFQGMKDMNEYFKEPMVASSYAEMSKLLVAGFVVSPHVVAARVKLTKEQKELWDLPDDVDENTRAKLLCPTDLVAASKADLPNVDHVRLICSKSNQTLINSGMPVVEPMENIRQSAKGRTCHIVLGRAPGAPSKNVDYDVAFALKRERLAKKEDVEVIDLEQCVVKRLGKYWVVYLKEMYSVNGFFASCIKPYAYENAIA